MATVIFWEKPGCGGNARQRDLLRAAGHVLDVRNLLAEPWTAERLRPYFGNAPVAAWFNPNAPRVKNGEVDPTALDADAALALMVAEPLLIHRPLLEVEGRLGSGFSAARGLGLLAEEQMPCANAATGAHALDAFADASRCLGAACNQN